MKVLWPTSNHEDLFKQIFFFSRDRPDSFKLYLSISYFLYLKLSLALAISRSSQLANCRIYVHTFIYIYIYIHIYVYIYICKVVIYNYILCWPYSITKSVVFALFCSLYFVGFYCIGFSIKLVKNRT